MIRSAQLILALLAVFFSNPVRAQLFFGQSSAVKTVGSALPACTATMSSNYIIIDPVSATTCTGGAALLYDDLNYCVCDQDDFIWRPLASTLGPPIGSGLVDTFNGRNGAVVPLTGDYNVSQVTNAVANSTLGSTLNGQGASMVGVEDAAGNFTSTDVEAALSELRLLGGGHGNGTNAAAGNAILGVDAAGNAEGIFDVETQVEADAHAADPSAHHYPPAVTVQNRSELYAALRALDQPDRGVGFVDRNNTGFTVAERVNGHIILSPDFADLSNHADPLYIDLPTGGSDQGRIWIELPEIELSSTSKMGIRLNWGRTSAPGVDAPCDPGSLGVSGFYEYEIGCMGVAHDTEVRISGGFIRSRDVTCTAATVGCNRFGIYGINSDRLYASPGGGSAYGTRLTIGPGTKCGGQTNPGFEPLGHWALAWDGDSCVSISPNVTTVNMLGDSFFEGARALQIRPAALGSALSETRITFGPAFHFLQVNSSSITANDAELSGLVDLQSPQGDSGSLFLDGTTISGRIGDVSGGTVRGSVNFNGDAATNCGLFPINVMGNLILNSSPGADISADLRLTGRMCHASILEADNIGNVEIAAIWSGTQPQYLQSDTVLTGGGVSRTPVLSTGATGSIGRAVFHLSSADGIPSTDMNYAELIDADILAGTGGHLSAAGSYVAVDLANAGHMYIDDVVQYASTVNPFAPVAATSFDLISLGYIVPGYAFGPDIVASTPGSTLNISADQGITASSVNGVLHLQLLGYDTSTFTTNISFDTTGVLYYKQNVVNVTGAAQTLTVREVKNSLVLASNAVGPAITLPNSGPATAGSIFCIIDMLGGGATHEIEVIPDVSDEIVIDGVAGGVGVQVTSAGVSGDKICLESINASQWVSKDMRGAWSTVVPNYQAEMNRWSGSKALSTGLIAAGACVTESAVAVAGVTSADVVSISPDSDITGVTGFNPVSTGALTVHAWSSLGNLNFKVCNPTASGITPGAAVTMNWEVIH